MAKKSKGIFYVLGLFHKNVGMVLGSWLQCIFISNFDKKTYY